MAYWKCENFFHDKLKGIIADFCSANFVSDEKNSTFSYIFLFIQNQIQMKKHCKITFV